MRKVDSGRVVRRYTQSIEAAPDVVFPLLCPVREGEWVDGWAERCEIVHSDSGLAEEGCVFRTRAEDGRETVWTVTRHDPGARVVEFHRVTAGLLATRLVIGVEGRPAGRSAVSIAYTLTPLGAAGRQALESDWDEPSFARDMGWWEQSMNHWLRTGQVLRH